MPRTAIFAIVLVVIGAGIYLTGRRDVEEADQAPATVSMPPRAKIDASAPAVSPSTSLSAKTAVGLDLRSLTSCHALLLTRREVEQSGCEQVDTDNKAALDQCQAQLANVNQRLQSLAAGAAPCPENLAEPSVYYEALRDRAQSGDPIAQRCFISGYFGQSAQDGKVLTPAEQDEYVYLAKSFIESALARGDWSVVRWLGRIRIGIDDGLLRRAYPIGQANPETIYKMKYLLVLGKQADPIEGVDPRNIVDGWRKDGRLTPDRFQNAENWAKQMYAQHFNGSTEQAGADVVDFCPSDR